MKRYYKTLLRYAVLLLFVTLMACSDDDDTTAPRFAGAWIIEKAEAFVNGRNAEEVIGMRTLPAWDDTHLTFTSSSNTTGTFSSPDTPDKTVWKERGSWTTTASNHFMRDDNTDVQYALGETRLSLTFKTLRDVAIAGASGYYTRTIEVTWHFQLKRQE